jgi:hypothetical protein
MKPGSRDKAYPVLISGTELAELKKLTWSMAEAFGLDRRIEEYKGQRPIGLYRWDLECLLEVIEMELHEMEARPGRPGKRRLALMALHDRLSELCAKAFADLEDHTR